MGNNASLDELVACGSPRAYVADSNTVPYGVTGARAIPAGANGSAPYSPTDNTRTPVNTPPGALSQRPVVKTWRYPQANDNRSFNVETTLTPTITSIRSASTSNQHVTTSYQQVTNSGEPSLTSRQSPYQQNVTSKLQAMTSNQSMTPKAPGMTSKQLVMTHKAASMTSKQPTITPYYPGSSPRQARHNPRYERVTHIAMTSSNQLKSAQWQAIASERPFSRLITNADYEDISTTENEAGWTTCTPSVIANGGESSKGSSGSTGQLNDASSSSSSLSNSQHFRSNPAINLDESGGGCDTSQQCLIRPLPPIPGSPKQASSGSIPVSQSAPLVSNGTSKGHSDSEKNALSARRQIESLRSEVTFLRKQLGQCQESIVRLQQREKTLQDRLSEQAQKHFNTGASKFEDLNLGENRPSALVRRYGNLYSEVRLDTFDALDDLPEIADFDDLKGKLLFSVVVLAFRSVQRALSDLRHKIRDLLCLRTDLGDNSKSSGADTSELAPIVSELEQLIGIYMRKSIDTFDISRNIQEVCNQVYATLYDYPTLRQCERLKTYISECVHISWALSVQHPPFVISYESKLFSDSMHTRFHSSDPDSDVIQSVLWPSLLEGGSDGACVHKGVVIT